ncbi:MAG TPA: GAF domain-containing protein, partial [Holophaga sp.]|nr:GAF domain-containing protein [Holophaga sp.]
FQMAQRISDEHVWHWDMVRGGLHWSPRAATLLGIDKTICVLSGDPFQTFVHPDDLPRASAAFNAHLKKGTPYVVEERLMTRTGYSWFLVRGKVVRSKEGRPLHMTGYLTDVHRFKQEAVDREKELLQTRDLAKEMAVINELSLTLTTRLSVEEVVRETYRQASRLLDTRNFAMSLYNPEKGEHEFVLNITESALDKETLTRQPANLGISGYVIHNRMPVLIRENSARWTAHFGVQPVGDPALSWLGVPLLLGNQVLGVIIVQNYHREHVYDEHDRDLLMTIASSAAVALQNARLFSEKSRTEAEAAQRTEQIRAALQPVQEAAGRIGGLAMDRTPDLAEISSLAAGILDRSSEILGAL